MPEEAKDGEVTLDLTDLDQWIGKRVVFAELWDPCSATDIRRWVQAMDYPNPIHWNEEFARESRFEGIVAPQSFTVAMDYGHGCHPTCVGKIPGSHLIFGGEGHLLKHASMPFGHSLVLVARRPADAAP